MTEAGIAKHRFTVAVSVASVLVTTAAIICAFGFSQSWLLFVFGVALLIGVGAQRWFITGVPSAKRGA